MALDKLTVKEQIKAELDKLGVKYTENAQPLLRGLSKIEAAEQSQDPNGYAEIRRIINLPIVKPLTDAEIESFSRSVVDAQYFEQGFRMRREQAEALLGFDEHGGVFGNLRVGSGKTAIGLMIADRAFRRGTKKILLLVPSPVYDQLIRADVPFWRPRVNLLVPIHGLAGKSVEKRLELAQSGYHGLYVLTYRLLSAKNTDAVLEAISPELVIADECHNLKNRHSTMGKRIVRLYEKKAPKLCAFSGTITSKRIRDYHHIAKMALGNNCPLPLATSMADDWGLVLDSDAEIPTTDELKLVTPLVEWAREKQRDGSLSRIPDAEKPVGFLTDGIRRSYRLRMVSAPGVVATSQDELGVSLTIANRPAPTTWTVHHGLEGSEQAPFPGYDRVESLLKSLDPKTGTWLTPNGDEIDYAIHLFKWRYEISSGFYHKLTWPDPEDYAKRRGISLQDAKDALNLSREHHAAQQPYHKELRKFLESESRPGLDSPFLVGSDMARNGALNVPAKLHELWGAMKALETAAKLVGFGLVERDSEAVRLCEYKIAACVEWAKALEGKGALIWVYHVEIGKWATEALRAAGIEAVHCPAGDTYNRLLLQPGIEKNVVVASMSAHGTGKNLQAFQENYFLQWPRHATLAEQTIGRTHRPGQTADELVIHTNNTTGFDHQNFYACLVDAMYVSQTNEPQKVIYAGYDPLPVRYPSSFLAERGFENQVLSKKAEQEMNDKFGGGEQPTNPT